jgi:hypothetical protein
MMRRFLIDHNDTLATITARILVALALASPLLGWLTE